MRAGDRARGLSRIAGLRTRLRRLEVATRPMPPELERALAHRWQELPPHVKTPSQVLGRRMTGCEGTHGVFPRCNLACTPCYHAREANRVRTDGDHTVAEIEAQMALLHERRGPGQNVQLIGGEVTLLGPEDHARALQAMHRHARKPMSMTHGDFDYDYLERLALGPDGKPRFTFLSFAGHFDSMMYGRRGIARPRDERELNEHRRRFCALFERLEREHGVCHYLAHNMTVTPANVEQVADVVRDCRDMGFRMLSFQPAAFVGNRNRWRHAYDELDGDAVWVEIERGAGTRLPHRAIQVGDERCNRTVHGAVVAGRYVPFLDDREPGDLAARDVLLDAFGGMDLEARRPLLAARTARALAARPGAVPVAARWAARFVRRAGGVRALRAGAPPHALTFVMHSFMDAARVRPAWEGLRRGELSGDPAIRATQERLQACSYAMAHPEDGALVPACVQHSVLDPDANRRLAELLPVAPAPSTPSGPLAAPET